MTDFRSVADEFRSAQLAGDAVAPEVSEFSIDGHHTRRPDRRTFDLATITGTDAIVDIGRSTVKMVLTLNEGHA
jgi:hypothetical protein